jgi:hypothetical protein
MLEEIVMRLPHMQSLETGHDRSRRASIQDLAVDLGGPSLRERSTGSQRLLVVAVAVAMVFWFVLRV